MTRRRIRLLTSAATGRMVVRDCTHGFAKRQNDRRSMPGGRAHVDLEVGLRAFEDNTR